MKNAINVKFKILFLLTFLFIVLNCFFVFANYHCGECNIDYDGNPMFAIATRDYRCPLGHLVSFYNPDDPRNISTDEIDGEELLKEHGMFHDKMKVIFNVDDSVATSSNASGGGGRSNSVLNVSFTKRTMQTLSKNLLDAINHWETTSLFKIFIGVGVFFLFISFMMSFYSNQMNREGKTIEQYTKMILQFILAFFIIVNVNNIAKIIVGIFSFTMDKAWGYLETESVIGADGSATSMNEIVDQITIGILRKYGLHKTGILDKAFGTAKMIMLNIEFTIPWLVSIIGKFGVLFAVIKCELTIFINVMLYPIAAHDTFDNIKQSSFLKYTKKIASSSLELTIIVLVLSASNTLLSGYMQEVLSGSNIDNAFNMGMISAMFQLTKMVVANSTASAIASSVFGG